MIRMKQIAAALSLAALFGGLFFGCERTKQEAPGTPDIPDIVDDPQPGALDGGLTTVNPGAKVQSRELTAFTLEYSTDRMYAEGSERAEICLPGRYTFSMETGEGGGAVCGLTYRDSWGSGERSAHFTADSSSFEALQTVLESSGLTDLNGFYAWNSALGYYCSLRADYASGESLSLYGEGGAAAEVPADVDAVVVFFSRLAEENGERFTRKLDPETLTESIWAWMLEHVPGLPEELPEERNVEVYDDFVELSASCPREGELPEWDIYARADREDGHIWNRLYSFTGEAGARDGAVHAFLAWAKAEIPGAADSAPERTWFQCQEEDDRDAVLVTVTGRGPDDRELWWAEAILDRDTKTAEGVYLNSVGEDGKSGDGENLGDIRLDW